MKSCTKQNQIFVKILFKMYLEKIKLFYYNVGVTYKDTNKEKYTPLAQLVEHLTFNQTVSGSNPLRCSEQDSALLCVRESVTHTKNDNDR